MDFQDENAMLNQLIQELPIGVLVEGPNAELLFYNQKSLQFLGLNAAQIRGQQPLDPDWRMISEDGTRLSNATHFFLRMISDHRSEAKPLGVRRQGSNETAWLGLGFSPKLDIGGVIGCAIYFLSDISAQRQAEAKQHESNAKYQVIYENKVYAVIIYDLETKIILDVNNRTCDLYGYSREEFLAGMSVLSLTAELEKTLEAIKSSQKTETLHITKRYHRKKDGTVFPVDIVGGQFRQDKRDTAFVMLSDTTERNQAEEARQATTDLLSAYISQSPIFTYIKEVTPERSVYLFASENFDQMLGIKGSEMIGKTNEDLVPLELAAQLNTNDWEVVTQGARLNEEREFNGKIYATFKSPISINGKKMLAGYTVDITQRKQSEAEIIKLNQGLEVRVLERTWELQNSLEKAEKLQDALVIQEKAASLTPLVAAVSHELNTPIGNIAVLSSALRERFTAIMQKFPAQLTAGDLRQFFEFLDSTNQLIFEGATAAAALIHSFKQIAVNRQGEQAHRFSLHKLVADCLLLSALNFKQAPIQLINDVPPDLSLFSLPGALSQVLENIVRNAFTHAFPEEGHGMIRVSAALKPKAEDRVIIKISDNGVGIAPHNRQKVFDPFFTTHLGSGGSGLGLSIAYNLAGKVLGGSLSLESRSAEDGGGVEGTGTTFSLEIPVELAAEA